VDISAAADPAPEDSGPPATLVLPKGEVAICDSRAAGLFSPSIPPRRVRPTIDPPADESVIARVKTCRRPKLNKFGFTDDLVLYNFRSVDELAIHSTVFVKRHAAYDGFVMDYRLL
jgi:hypothetical protein